MNIFRYFEEKVQAALEALVAEGALPAGLDFTRVAVEPPRDPSHGDLSTNAAMVLAKPAGAKPRDLAELIAARLATEEAVTEVSVAGPGFINLRLDPSFWRSRVPDILRAGASYGAGDLGTDQAVNVEYVSANPTGPMHVGHVRAELSSAMRSRTCSKRSAIAFAANTTSTTLAGRSKSSRGAPFCATAKHSGMTWAPSPRALSWRLSEAGRSIARSDLRQGPPRKGGSGSAGDRAGSCRRSDDGAHPRRPRRARHHA